MIRKAVFLGLVWLVLVILAARFVPNWYIKNSYDELITPQAQVVLQQQKNLRIEVFTTPDSVAAGLVNNFLEPLKPHLPEVTIEYLDILSNPELVQTYGITQQGEMVIHRQDANFHLNTLSYEAFFNGLKQLSQDRTGANEQWLVFLDNTGGKSFNTGDITGLSAWLNVLKQSNYRTVVLPFQSHLQLPNNVKLIVLASPQTTWGEPEIQWLQQQINQGISVMWLADPATAIEQPGLSLLFDVMRTDAYHQGHLVIKAYNQHAINHSFDRPLDLVEVMPYITSDEVLWQNEQHETLASTRELGSSRLMVVGDSDFLSNAHLRSGGNLEMSFRMVDWLLHRDDRIDLPNIGVLGAQIHFQSSEILLFATLTLIVIPLLFLLIGGWRWYRNKQ
ncbi:MAG: hypothetical protein R3E90_09805 [Marinicella sp.]